MCRLGTRIDDGRSCEHAREITDYPSQPDGSSNAPMRTAKAHIDTAL
jgi:hypothetical protein